MRDSLMPHLLDWHALHWLDPSHLVTGLWVGLALAATVYDIGRWLSAW
jgi:hypothetical protein